MFTGRRTQKIIQQITKSLLKKSYKLLHCDALAVFTISFVSASQNNKRQLSRTVGGKTLCSLGRKKR